MKILPPLGATAEPSLPEAEKVPELNGLIVAGGSLSCTIFPSVTRKPLEVPSIFEPNNLQVRCRRTQWKFENIEKISCACVRILGHTAAPGPAWARTWCCYRWRYRSCGGSLPQPHSCFPSPQRSLLETLTQLFSQADHLCSTLVCWLTEVVVVERRQIYTWNLSKM